MTQEQLSLATGIDRAYLSLVETGRRTPSIEILMRLCVAMGESAGVVLGRVEGLELLPGVPKGLAKLVYDENGVLTKIVDDQGRELVADFRWIEPGVVKSSERIPSQADGTES